MHLNRYVGQDSSCGVCNRPCLSLLQNLCPQLEPSRTGPPVEKKTGAGIALQAALVRRELPVQNSDLPEKWERYGGMALWGNFSQGVGLQLCKAALPVFNRPSGYADVSSVDTIVFAKRQKQGGYKKPAAG